MTSFTDSAAPPRASPSSLVSTTPVRSIGLGERLGDVDGLLAGHRVDDEQRVVGVDTASRDAAQLVHQLGVDLEPAGGVDDHDVAAEALGFLRRRRARPRPGRCRSMHTGTPIALAEDPQLLDGRGALQVGADEQHAACPSCSRRRASFAAAVVLPEPWRPAIRMTVGGCDVDRELAGRRHRASRRAPRARS